MDYCSLIVGDHTVVTAVGVIDGGRVACPNLESAVVELPRSIEPIVPRIERDRQPRIVLIEVFGIGINQTALFGVNIEYRSFRIIPDLYDQCTHVIVVLVAGGESCEQRQTENKCGERFHND